MIIRHIYVIRNVYRILLYLDLCTRISIGHNVEGHDMNDDKDAYVYYFLEGDEVVYVGRGVD